MPLPRLLLRRAIAPAALVLLAAACTRDLADPAGARTPAAGARHTASSGGQPRFNSNAVKYRDAGAKPSTGRAGSSTLAARALLGKDGVTQLEVTTGAFGAGSAPRPLKHLQVKQLDASGSALRTFNYTGFANGTAALEYTGLARGHVLQVQGNVEEPRRTAVVTVAETVHLRPDLRVQLQAPATVALGMPVNVVAVVSEGNGDVGARANCVLYVDGVEADRASGIWVDAGDAVSCLFSHNFSTAGEKHLRVEVTGVSPADFDAANNTAEATVQVNGASDFDYYAQAEEYVEESISTDSSYLVYDDGQRSNQTSVNRQTYRWQASMFNGWMRRGISLASTSIHVSQSTNGATVHEATYPEAVGHEYAPLSGYPECMSRWSDGLLFYICSTGDEATGLTNYQYVRSGVNVAYHGVFHASFWWADAPENVWSYTSEWDGTYGYDAPPITIGPDYSFLVEVTEGGRTWRATATVQLNPQAPTSWTYYPPDGRLCTSEYQGVPGAGYLWNLCRHHRAEGTWRTGWTGYYTQENSGL